ncbi:sodium:solute symporter family protein [Granulicella tundricola]|uniref:SSS sodium solute transporter superfamily n=1 Tax=Granulicella tundricola (strain ATCC BAA-1859 / DSM 23138 / MP5ACTX9) TaxID=1198114 RepID=E8WY46_GRATM|nr:sodium:solute symporter family protein [Granulicella tundricola]ADW68673.1 SSS sodium solute transporter superfamily [Granulicella tundricola MP5ACTX9]
MIPQAAHLSPVDWLIMLVYFSFVLGIGFALKRYMRTSNDFFLAGRAIPAWVCGLAFISANLGAQEVIGMGASGAKYGIITSHFYWIGAIPAMVFVGIFMMPFYYGSKARSVPEYLRMRFDEKTRALNAISFAFMTVISSGISMYAMALLIQTLGLFHGIIPDQYIFHVSVILSGLIVLGYIFLGGLTSAIYNEVLQFFLIVAGFAPLVWIGLRNVGGWQGIKQTLPATMTHSWRGMAHASTNSLGVEWVGLAMGLGFVLSFGYWCTDFLVIQRAMAADSEVSARRVPLIAAIPKMFFPFLVILPGLIAVTVTSHMASTPAPSYQSPTTHHSSLPLDEAHPHGIIPEKLNPVTGQPMLSADGTPVYNYDLAIPVMLLRFFPTGILGLGLTALLASFMSGMAGNVTAFNTVWTYDIYQAYINKRGTDEHYLWMGRMATIGGVLLSIGAAYLATSFNNIMDALQLIFSLVNAPLFATFLLGMFWKRTTGHAAFTGLLAGTGAALLHHGLTLPADATPGIHGAWLHLVHTYPSDMAQNFWTAIFAFSVNLIVTAAVSLITEPRREAELVGLVYSLTPKPIETHLTWYQKPATLGAAVLAMLVVLNLIFA